MYMVRLQETPFQKRNKERWGFMQCGAKCFVVEIEKENGERITFPVNARTPVNARKTARLQLTKNDKIIAVTRK